jgi:hypothetical protein
VLDLGGLLATDADSLKTTPSGGLILSGEADNAFTIVNNPGLASQTAASTALINAMGGPAGAPDDLIFPTATAGTFFVADTAANTVYAITGTGLSGLYGNVGGSFGSINTSSGLFTEDVAGQGFHGMDFVAIPEPSTSGAGITACLLFAFYSRRKRARC